MKRKLVSLLVVCTMLISMCTSLTFVASASDVSIDAYSTSILSSSFDSDAAGWGNATLDSENGILGLTAGKNTNCNWPDAKIHQGLISYEFDYMIPADAQISGTAYFGMRDSNWGDNKVNFFALTSTGYVRKAFNNDWSNLYQLTPGNWYTFKIVLDTATGEYWVYVAPQGEALPNNPVIRSEGRYSASNPAANGVRGVTFVNFGASVTDVTVTGAYVDNVKVNKLNYAYEAINAASSDDEIFDILSAYAESKNMFVSEALINIINKSDLITALKAQPLTSEAELISVINTVYADDSYKQYVSYDFESSNPIPSKTVIDGALASDVANPSKYLDASATSNTTFNVADLGIVPEEAVVEFRAKPVGTTWFFFNLATGGKGAYVNWSIDASTATMSEGWTYYRLVLAASDANSLDDVTAKVYYSADGITWTERAISALGTKFTLGSAATPDFKAPISSIVLNRCYVDDLKIYQYGTAPEAKEASVAFNGEAFEASYTYYDAEGDAKSGESYVWQSSADDVTYADISGATSKTWTPSDAYLGKYIRCIITPSSAKYPTTGEPVATEGVKYAQYIEVYSNNFENADPATDTTIVDGDGVNTSKFKTVAKGGSFDVKPGTTIADDLVIDVRLKAVDGTTYSSVQAIFQNWGGLVVGATVDGNMAGYNAGWTYYRLVVDSDQATELADVTYALYKSADGLSWTKATTKKLTAEDRGAEGSAVSRLYNLTQIRFNNAYVDDICIYKYGTAPVGANGKVTAEGDSLIASFDYSDAEGDTQGIAGYAWEVSDDNVTFAPVEGDLGANWAPGGKYNGKYVRATITPKSSKYPTDGETIVTESVKYKAGYVEHLFIDYEDKDPEADATIIDGATAGDTQNTSKYKNGGKNFSINIGSYIPDELTVEFRAKSIPYEENGKQLQYHTVYLIGNNWGGCVTMVIMDAATPGYTTGWNYYRIVLDSVDATAKNEVKVKYFISADGEHWNKISDDVVARKTTVTPPGANGTYADNVNLLRFDWAQVDDIRVYQYGTAPEADGAFISITDDGTFATVEGYSDAEGDAEDYHKCQWQYSTDNVTFTDIAGQTGYKFNDDGKYDGAYLRCLVYPTSTKWPCYGEAILTDSIVFESSKDAYVTYNHFNNSDEPASTYVPTEGFKTVFVANNNTADLLPLMVVCGVYNIETHELVKVNMETVTLNPEEKGREIPLTNVALTQEEIPSEGTFVKVMVRNSNNMKPYNKVGYVLETEAE